MAPPSDKSAPSPLSEGELARVGDVRFHRFLADAPGGKYLEVRVDGGESRLLQCARLKAVSKADAEERDRYIAQLDRMTEELKHEPDLRILAYGTLHRDDGTALVYWMLPWRDGCARLGHAAAHVRSLAHLLVVSLSLAERVHHRHEHGRLDPLLSESVVVVKPGSGAAVPVVPIALRPLWLADDMLRPRLAPEEVLQTTPMRTGDLWRLGHTLRGVAQEMGDLPDSLRRVYDMLADPEPALRCHTAADAVHELRVLQGLLSAESRPTDETWLEDISPRAKRSTSDLPVANMRPTAPAPHPIVDAPTVLDLNIAASPRKRAANEKKKENLVGFDLKAPVRAEVRIEDIGRDRSIELNILSPVDPAETLARSDTKLDEAKSAWDVAPGHAPQGPGGTIIGLRKVGPGGTVVGAKLPRELLRPSFASNQTKIGIRLRAKDLLKPQGPAGTLLGVRPMAALLEDKGAESTAPEFISELSDTDGSALEPRSVFAQETGMHAPPDIRPRAGTPATEPPPSTQAPVASPPVREQEPNAAPARAAQRQGPARGTFRTFVEVAVVAVASGLVTYGLIRWLSSEERLVSVRARTTISSLGEVVVETTPDDAVVVSEDGRILGRPPIRLLVPPGGGPRLLVAAHGHVPQQLTLPERGRVLVPLSKVGGSRCALPTDTPVETVAADIHDGTQISDAALVRSADLGAWIYRCEGTRVPPSRKRRRTSRVQVTAPVTATLSVDGQSYGPIPVDLEVESGMRQFTVQVEGRAPVERWVPIEIDTSLELPTE